MKFKTLSRAQRELIEEILRKYPEKEMEHKNLGDVIAGLCRAPSIVFVDGASLHTSSEPEKIIEAKESDKRFTWLDQHIAIVRKGLRSLNKKEKQIISMFFWEQLTNDEISRELSLQKRYILKIKSKALFKLAQTFISNFVG